MYRIGEFSYLFQVTIKTLRHYDKIGLFKPAEKDPFTGYRYYKEEQKEEFQRILKLRELGFSLDEIKILKDEIDDEKILKKIEELDKEQKTLKEKKKALENLKNKGDIEMKYEIGMTYDKKICAVGKKIIVKKRNEEELETYFKEIENKLTKMKVNCKERVIITEEVGFKKEDVELFIGYTIGLNKLKLEKFDKKSKKIGLERYENPTMDYLVAIGLKDANEVEDACSEMIEYAKLNEIQIIGPFTEIYNKYEDEILVYALAQDLKKPEDILIERREKLRREKLKEFIPNDKIIGTWKIKEILPNVRFDITKQKSEPITELETLEILEEGKTDKENITWTSNYLLIEYNNETTDHLIHYFELDGKEFLEIRMNDMTKIYKNASPISYIYERVKPE